MNAKYKYPILIAGIAVVLLITYKGAVPLAFKAAQSDLFMMENDDPGELEAKSNNYTEAAFKQCNEYIKGELDSKLNLDFSPKPINTWGLGNYEYLVNAEIHVTDGANQPKTEKYACRIHYDKAKDEAGLADKNSWTILGISGISEL